MAPKTQTYPDPIPVQLPIDPWLYDCAPQRDCAHCSHWYRKRQAALRARNVTEACQAASKVRDHDAGLHTGPVSK